MVNILCILRKQKNYDFCSGVNYIISKYRAELYPKVEA